MNNHICFISTVHRANDTRIFFKEILSLANAGYQIDFIVKEIPGNPVHPNVTYQFLPLKKGLSGRIRNLYLAFKFAKKLPDKICHIHDPELILIAIPLKLFYRKKIIYDIHEIHSNEIKYKPYLPKILAYPVSFIFRFVEKLALHIFDKNILAEKGYCKYFPPRKTEVIQNFIPARYVLPKPARYFEKDGTIKIVYLGTITKIRGVWEVLELGRILKAHQLNFELHLIGPFHPEPLEAEVKRKAHTLGLSQDFHYWGTLPFPEAQKIVKECDIGLIFLHPIINNLTILPTKLFEYMGNGLTVLMSDFPLWKKFNKKFRAGLTVDIFQLEKEFEKILKFLNNTDSLNSIRKKNIENVKNSFVWEIEEKKLLSLYSELIGDSQKGN